MPRSVVGLLAAVGIAMPGLLYPDMVVLPSVLSHRFLASR
jgi:hypothetical protein